MSKSLFQASDYFRYRLPYPQNTFQFLKPFLRPGLQVLDVGAGTGFSAASFLDFYPLAKMALLEPDREMLATAIEELKNFPQVTCALEGRAEKIPFGDQSIDLILVASAWHWMNYQKSILEFERVLSHHGIVFIFEYQFPKALASVELNEWVRRQFNLYWRAPEQTPRGSLFEITASLRESFSFSQISKVEFSETQSHTLSDFAGMIFSQSRFLHYESTLDKSKNYREEILGELKKKWGLQNEIQFLYPYQGLVFQKRL